MKCKHKTNDNNVGWNFMTGNKEWWCSKCGKVAKRRKFTKNDSAFGNAIKTLVNE